MKQIERLIRNCSRCFVEISNFSNLKVHKATGLKYMNRLNKLNKYLHLNVFCKSAITTLVPTSSVYTFYYKSGTYTDQIQRQDIIGFIPRLAIDTAIFVIERLA